MLLHKLLPLAFLVAAVSSFCVKDPVKEAREDGKIAVVMLLKGSCPYCQSQAAKLYRWYSLLQDFQNDFEIIFVNLKGNQHMGILKAITFNKFSYYQDTENRNIWGSFDVNDGAGGKKDDVFLFGADGKMTYVSSSSRSSDMGAADASCSQKEDIPVIKTLLQLISKKNAGVETTSPSPMCDDTMALDFNEIFKRRSMKNMKKHNKHKGKGKGKGKGKKKNMKKGKKDKKEQGRKKENKQKKKELKKKNTASAKNTRRTRKLYKKQN